MNQRPTVRWQPRPTPETDRAAAADGLTSRRDLLQMRRSLPVSVPVSIEVRPFIVGQDEEAWLAVNNRAFADHPEQGAWDRKTLEATFTEPWFDPSGFLLHERGEGGRLAGFCWTKEHREDHPVLGEIFVIAVDPDFFGLGLGRALTLAGLDNLHRNGISTAMLYVDSQNKVALHMYETMNFTVDHIRRGYFAPIHGQE